MEKDEKDIENIDLDLDSEGIVSENIESKEQIEEGSNNALKLEEKLASQDEFAFLDEENKTNDEFENEKNITLDETDDYNSEGNQELITVRPVKFQQFEQSAPNRTIKRNLDIMQDVSLHISVELGRTKSSIREVMELEKGSIVELDKIAGEQVEIFVNGKLVAKGEVIVIEDKFGVRVTSTNIQKTIQ